MIATVTIFTYTVKRVSSKKYKESAGGIKVAAKEFTAVVFDMDGIIFDSERRVIECWKEVAQKYNIPDIEQACIECTGINAKLTVKKMLERYGQDFPYDTYRKEASALFQSRYSNGRLPVKPGVTELLEALKKQIGRAHV